MRRYLELYRLIERTFGARLRPVGTFGLLQLRHALSAVTLGLDGVLDPGVRDVPIDRPIFILGNPRSGTTFLHRLLHAAGASASFETWEMLLPAITARRALGGLVERLGPLSPTRYHVSDAHATGLREIETDDVLWFFRTLDGPFLWSYFQAWEDDWGSALSRRTFDLDDEPRAEQERLFRYYEACWRRNLRFKGAARILVKSSIFTLRVRALLRRYPDCRIIYIARDPVETIPSGMSLLTGVLENAYGMSKTTSEQARRRYFENLYQASCHMLRHFHEVHRSGAIPERNLHVVPYPSLVRDLEPAMNKIMSFLECDLSPAFGELVRAQAASQRTHVSRHGHSPEQFGLTAARIREDTRFVYETYLG